MNELILRKDWNFERVPFADIKQYFTDDFIIVQVKDYDSTYSFSLGKVWVLPFLPGLGDTRFASYEVGEGFNLIPNPGLTEQFRVIFQPFSRLKRCQLSIWRTDYMSTIRQILDNSATAGAVAADLDILESTVSSLESQSVKQSDFPFPAIIPANETYGYSHVIIQHGFNDQNPSVQILNQDKDAELLQWKVIDEDSIVIDIRGASSLPSQDWIAVITAKSEPVIVD